MQTNAKKELALALELVKNLTQEEKLLVKIAIDKELELRERLKRRSKKS